MFIRLSIQRPIAVAMAYLAVSLLGIAAWRNLPIEFLPDTSYPRLRVTAGWSGASPEATEAFLTAPLEAAIQQFAGVHRRGVPPPTENELGAPRDIGTPRRPGRNPARQRLESGDRTVHTAGVRGPHRSAPPVHSDRALYHRGSTASGGLADQGGDAPG